jgi:hypothetical protein
MITSRQILYELQEDYKFSFKSRHGLYCEVFKNPSLKEIQSIPSKFLRIIISKENPDDYYIWDADAALHYEVEMELYNKKLDAGGEYHRDVFSNKPDIISRIKHMQQYLKKSIGIFRY